jgi:hypothetical protein
MSMISLPSAHLHDVYLPLFFAEDDIFNGAACASMPKSRDPSFALFGDGAKEISDMYGSAVGMSTMAGIFSSGSSSSSSSSASICFNSSSEISISVVGSPSPAKPSFLICIMPHTINRNTTVCRVRPAIDGHPFGLDTHAPRIRRMMMNVLGFATIKKIRAEMTEITNLSRALDPLQPHPQSLKKPIVYCSWRKKFA